MCGMEIWSRAPDLPFLVDGGHSLIGGADYKIRRQQAACWTYEMLLTSLPVTPPLTPPQGQHFRLLRGGSTYQRRFTKSVRCQFVKNIGVFDSPRPAAHRQHRLHHPHQRLPRMRMMQVMLGMLPMLVKEMKGGKGERISTAKGGERSQGGKGEDLGKKCKIFGRKREIFLGGTRP